jgi:hypothetical protein
MKNFFLGLSLSLGIGFISTQQGTTLLGVVILVLFSIIITSFFVQTKDVSFMNTLFLAFGIRVILLFVHLFFFPLPDADTDAMMFERTGWYVAESWSRGVPVESNGLAFIYSLLIGIIYAVFGRIPMLPIFLNVVLGIILVYTTYEFVRWMTNSLTLARMAALITSIFPSMVLYSVILRRDMIIMLLILLISYRFTRWIFEKKKRHLFLGKCVLFDRDDISCGDFVYRHSNRAGVCIARKQSKHEDPQNESIGHGAYECDDCFGGLKGCVGRKITKSISNVVDRRCRQTQNYELTGWKNNVFTGNCTQ